MYGKCRLSCFIMSEKKTLFLETIILWDNRSRRKLGGVFTFNIHCHWCPTLVLLNLVIWKKESVDSSHQFHFGKKLANFKEPNNLCTLAILTIQVNDRSPSQTFIRPVHSKSNNVAVSGCIKLSNFPHTFFLVTSSKFSWFHHILVLYITFTLLMGMSFRMN